MHLCSLRTPGEERRPCTFGRPQAGRGGPELNQSNSRHHLCPHTPTRALQGTQSSRVPEAGEEKRFTPPTRLHPPHPGHEGLHPHHTRSFPRAAGPPKPHQPSPAPEPQHGRAVRGPDGRPRPPSLGRRATLSGAPRLPPLRGYLNKNFVRAEPLSQARPSLSR